MINKEKNINLQLTISKETFYKLSAYIESQKAKGNSLNKSQVLERLIIELCDNEITQNKVASDPAPKEPKAEQQEKPIYRDIHGFTNEERATIEKLTTTEQEIIKNAPIDAVRDNFYKGIQLDIKTISKLLALSRNQFFK